MASQRSPSQRNNNRGARSAPTHSTNTRRQRAASVIQTRFRQWPENSISYTKFPPKRALIFNKQVYDVKHLMEWFQESLKHGVIKIPHSGRQLNKSEIQKIISVAKQSGVLTKILEDTMTGSPSPRLGNALLRLNEREHNMMQIANGVFFNHISFAKQLIPIIFIGAYMLLLDLYKGVA